MESATTRDSRRLLSFAVTVIGALLMGVGACLTWVTVGIADQLSVQAVSPGTDLVAGLVTLVCAVVILVLMLLSRAVREGARRLLGIVVVVAAALASLTAAWFLYAAPDHYSPVNDDQLVNELAQVLQKSPDEIRSALAQVVDQLGGYTHIGIGPWLALAGGLLAIVGGVLSLRWAAAQRRVPAPTPADAPVSTAGPAEDSGTDWS